MSSEQAHLDAVEAARREIWRTPRAIDLLDQVLDPDPARVA